MNEILRHALLAAHLDEVDIAARLEVDPKTVRRWLEGRLPQTRHRWALANLLNLNETDLWPELRSTPSRPDELLAIYPHRSSIPREIWRNLFASAEREIGILDYSSLFLAKDTEIIRIFTEKARSGVSIRIALGDPSSLWPTEYARESIGDVLTKEIRDALALYQPFQQFGIGIRLHQVALYNSIYRADNELLCDQHMYAIPAVQSPVLHLRRQTDGGLSGAYLDSFDRIWEMARL